MFDFIAGLPGQMATLLARLTATRATNLDNLDAAVSTRAAASTALSTATWTGARAANLDTIPSLLTSAIKSIQQISLSLASVSSASATITSVNTAKAIVVPAGAWLSGGTSITAADTAVMLNMTSATNVTATRGTSNGTLAVRFFVVEFN